MAGSDAVVCHDFHSDRVGGLRPARWSCVSSLVFTPDWVDGAEAERVGSQESASAPRFRYQEMGTGVLATWPMPVVLRTKLLVLGLLARPFGGITPQVGPYPAHSGFDHAAVLPDTSVVTVLRPTDLAVPVVEAPGAVMPVALMTQVIHLAWPEVSARGATVMPSSTTGRNGAPVTGCGGTGW